MSGQVKIQGVDGIKFDDAYINDQKVNLALGKDTRPARVKYAHFFQTIMPLVVSLSLLVLGLTALRTFALPMMILSVFFAWRWRRKRHKFFNNEKSLFDTPKYLNYTAAAAEIDYEPKKNSKKVEQAAPGVGEGVFFFGHELFTGQEIHVRDDRVRTHIIIFGTTGSGKTENILSICVNFLTQASGFILVDGKGDTLLFAKTFSLCRAYGRCDDLYLLNFMDPGDRRAKTVDRNTHKFNFFVDSVCAEANEIVGGLLPNEGGGGSGMWEARASTGINSLNKALYYLKDNGYLEIDPDTYRSYFALDAFVELAMNENIPKPYRAGLHTVLSSINYKLPTAQDPNPKQNPATEEQFQYITMQYTSTFNTLAEEYAHITVSQVPDISITDVVLRRRILLVLLPSLAKSEQSVRNLGRIIIAMTRNVSSKAIGGRVEGNIESTINSKPTAAISSFGLIFDEFGAYATKGAATLPAQVRSLNIVCIFAGQDYEAFKKGDEIEADTIFANCTLKICMKLESPLTYEKFRDSAGHRYIMVQDSYEIKETAFGVTHIPAETSRVEKRDVLDLVDLKGQTAGQETLIYGDKTYRMQAFYADPKLTSKARLNHFLEIRRPGYPAVQAMRRGVDELYRKLKERMTGDWESLEELSSRGILTFSTFNDELSSIFYQVDQYQKSHSDATVPDDTELAVFALCAFVKKVELVDHNIRKALHQSLGYNFDENFDDLQLLGGDDANMDGFQTSLPSASDDDGYDDDEDGFDEDFSGEHSQSGSMVPPAPQEEPAKSPLLIDMALLDKIDRAVEARRTRLSAAEQDSFNSLEAINMSVFDTQRHIRQLEEVLLRQQGFAAKDAARLSELTAANLVVDMGLKTNPAVVGATERRRKTSSRSAKEVKQLVSNMIDRA